MDTRTIQKIVPGRPTIEGAGVHLKRAFGFSDAPHLDPFLLLDDFSSDNPDDYLAGFPWHPHRGIETVTYMISGEVKHGDSIGNSGVIRSGDIQWMTAGGGIIHQEMPHAYDGFMQGFQLWVNLPSSHKMMNPRYRGILSGQIPEVIVDENTTVKIICGEVQGIRGPVGDIVVETEYLDCTVAPDAGAVFPVKAGFTAFAYVFEGKGYFDPQKKKSIEPGHLVVFDDGKNVKITTEGNSVRFLLVSGKPIGETVAWYGPIVMNTQEELEVAFREYRDGTFIKYDGKRG